MSLERSLELFHIGKFDESLAIIEACIRKEGKVADYISLRARINTRLGSFDLALEDFDFLQVLEPFNPSIINDRAVVLHLLKRNDEAMAEFDRALNLDPKNPYRFASRAYFKDRIGDLHGAIEDYEKAIELDPEDAVSHNNKGLVEEKLGYIAKAKKSYEKADELVGYKPEQKNNSPKEGQDQAPPIFPEINKTQKTNDRLTVRYFLETLNRLVSDKATQQEFKDFLKKKLDRK
jgi:tetratricopeptide (TPR) repeat protein